MAQYELSDALVMESALEVANPIGGICTVIKTKAPSLIKEIGKHNLLMLGVKTNTSTEFVEMSSDEFPFVKEAVRHFESVFHIHTTFAEWRVDPDPDLCPYVLLFDNIETQVVLEELEKSMYFLGSYYNIHFPYKSTAMDYFKYHALLLGTFVHLFVRCTLEHLDDNPASEMRKRPIILQSHEWCGSLGQILLKRRDELLPNGHLLRTVFTTHATIMGRFLSADNQNITEMIRNNHFPTDTSLFNEAERRMIPVEFRCEWAAAHTCDSFTAVSNTTADEAAAFLKRRPDAITYNGSKRPSWNTVKTFQPLNTSLTPEISPKRTKAEKDDGIVVEKEMGVGADATPKPTTIREPIDTTTNKENLLRMAARAKLDIFVRRQFFGPSLQTMDLNKTVYVMCCGRNEFSNKGIDVFIDSLAKLNTRLKGLQERFSRRLDISVVGILITPSLKVLPPVMVSGHFDYVEKVEQDALARSGGSCDLMEVLKNLPRYENPPLCVGCVDGANEEIIQKCLAANLANHPLDPVKFVWVPKFMPFGNALPMSINEVYEGIDMGVFPSKYEPWGYTPIECLEHGIPAITTNLAGCGCFYEHLYDEKALSSPPVGPSLMVKADSWRGSESGLTVIDRQHANYEEVATRVCDSIFDYLTLDEAEVNDLRARCLKSSTMCSWDNLIKNYVGCYRRLAEEVRN